MSSFQKRRNLINIPGTKPSLQNGQLLVSTGNLSLDHILGGGIPIGSILLIEEDKFVSYSKVLSKYFLAEAIVQNHPIFLASLEENPKDLMKKIPTPVEVIDSEHKKKNTAPNDDMRIAWRYNDLPMVNSEQTVKNSAHYFDLTKQVDQTVIDQHDIVYWQEDRNRTSVDSKSMFKNEIYQNLLTDLSKKVNEETFSNSETSTQKNKNLLRIVINSLGSPLWYQEHFASDVCKFLALLKVLVRNSLSSCLLTIPTHLFKYIDEDLSFKIRNLIDYGVQLESFAGSDKETNPIFKEYHGLLHIKKNSALNTLAPFCPEVNDLAFKLRRKKFIIEKLHLPPELQESDQREQDDVPSASCGSSKKHLLEF